jgi:calcium-dependent protein kinase
LKGSYSLNEPEWDDISADAKDLVKKMLEYDPSKRTNAAEAL